MRYLPDDAIVLAVVDPNVGADRDIAVETKDGRILVGPDNGLLSSAWAAAGGVARAVEITSPDVIVEPVAPSFHARDVLSPAAAHLAAGMPLEALGAAIEPGSLASLDDPRAAGRAGEDPLRGDRLRTASATFSSTSASPTSRSAASTTPRRLSVESLAGWVEVRRAETYADFDRGEYGLIFDPRGWLTIIRGNPGNALQDLHLSIGDMLWITETGAAGSGSEARR